MSKDVRVLHYLLGDPLRRDITVDDWLRQARRPLSERDQTVTVRIRDTITGMLDEACAHLHDSRLFRAQEEFIKVVSITQNDSLDGDFPYFNLVGRLGAAQCAILLKRHRAAENLLQRVIELAGEGPSVIACLASWFEVLNLSDWGRAVSVKPHDLPPENEHSAGLAMLLRAQLAYVASRLFLRSGQPDRGLAVLREIANDKSFSSLAPIPRGRILRMNGILLDVSGQTNRARGLLDQAHTCFRGAHYHLGEVQTAFSLSRLHLRLDPKQSKGYIKQAKEILKGTDEIGQEGGPGRQMFAEKAALQSHLAQIELLQGNTEEAIRLVREDIEQIKHLAQPQDGGLPRQLAQAYRQLGTMLVTQGQNRDALKQFSQSVRFFEKAGDEMSAFFSRVRLSNTLLALGRFEELVKQVESLELALQGRTSRNKERAVVGTFKAAIEWKKDALVARAILRQVIEDLQKLGHDYHYISALLLDGDIMASQGDNLGAHHRYSEARTCALAIEALDSQKQAERRLQALGVSSVGEKEIELKRTELTIFFADLRGFTAASAKTTPIKMAQFIKDFAEVVSRATTRHGGRPTRFLGDCVMSLFGLRESAAPKELLAIRAACEIDELFRSLLRRHWDHGSEFPVGEIGIGFGIATGSVVVGRFGWQELSEFSAIGDEVNFASRIQGQADDGEINTCAKTYEVLRNRLASLRCVQESGELKGLGNQTWYRILVTDLLEATPLLVAPRTIPADV